MTLPKALLISLGDYEPGVEEAKLRAAGFATAPIAWKDLLSQPTDWMQLSPVLQDELVVVLAFAGDPKDLTPDVLAKITLLTLSIDRPTLVSAFILCEEQGCELPEALGHFKQYHSLDPFGGKLMAERFRAQQEPWEAPFYVRSHLDPLIGLWLEVGTNLPGGRQDFLVGVTEAKITAFGVGNRGVIPARSTLSYPILGIEGELQEAPFSACAARNALTQENACYCRLEEIPTGVFMGKYPDETDEQDQDDVSFIRFV